MFRAAAAAGVLIATLVVLWAGSPGSATAAQKPCSAYPTPGSVAAAKTRLPAWLTARYAVLKRRQRPLDRLKASQLGSSLTAAGLVLSHTRFLGKAAFGGRIYLIPAKHLLAFKLAPARCLPSSEQSLEQELAPQLRSQYRHWALCVIIVHSTAGSPSCGAAGADPEALLYASGTPGFGLVPDGIPDVTVSYLTAPPRTLKVHDNFFVVDAPRQPAAPCALQWQDASGNVTNTFAGCDYVQSLQPQLYAYRGYVQTTLSTLQGQVGALAAAISGGNLAQAEQDWLSAHLTWQDLGQDDGAYSAYGALGSELDGIAGDGLAQSDSISSLTGFHKVEYDLWRQHDLTAAAADIAQLQQILARIVATPLTSAFPDTTNGVASWLLRPHETLEDAIRDTLSGDDDYGSGTGVASVTADVAATEEYLDVLAPVLGPVAPGLIPRARAELSALDNACAATRVAGQWVAVSALPTRQREQLDADAGAAAEILDAIPGLLTSIGRAAPSD